MSNFKILFRLEYKKLMGRTIEYKGAILIRYFVDPSLALITS